MTLVSVLKKGGGIYTAGFLMALGAITATAIASKIHRKAKKEDEDAKERRHKAELRRVQKMVLKWQEHKKLVLECAQIQQGINEGYPKTEAIMKEIRKTKKLQDSVRKTA